MSKSFAFALGKSRWKNEQIPFRNCLLVFWYSKDHIYNKCLLDCWDQLIIVSSISRIIVLNDCMSIKDYQPHLVLRKENWCCTSWGVRQLHHETRSYRRVLARTRKNRHMLELELESPAKSSHMSCSMLKLCLW